VRRGTSRAGSIGIAVGCSLLAMSAGGIHGGDGATDPVPIQVLAMVGAFAMIGVSVLLVWRHRHPVVVSAAAIVGTLVFPTTPVPALVAVAALAFARAGWVRWAGIAATWLATSVACLWDVAAPTSYIADLAGGPAAGSAERVTLLWVVPLVAAVAVAPFAAYGIGRRVRAERDAARRGTAAAERNAAVLHREVSLERERQAIARDLHDTLAARLSSISLHAGALELQVADGDQRTVAAARAVRESAQNSLDDLRNVVRVLRDPSGAHPGPAGLGELGGLVDAALRDGADVRSQIMVDDPVSLDPEVAHTVYRIVQESISNARRHAPGAALFVDVRGGPETGVSVRAYNWLVPEATPTSVGSGLGVTGMSERVALVGGAFHAAPTPEGTYAVVAWMPWTRR
jgi:signal transduction histidine kinase